MLDTPTPRRRPAALWALIATLSACGSEPAPPVAPAPSPEPAPVVGDVVLQPSGEVSVDPLGNGTWVPVVEPTVLVEGEGVKTGVGATATVLFPDGSVARLNAESTLYLAALSTPESPSVSLQLVTGEVWSRVQRVLPNANFEVRTDTTLAVVRGTEFSVAVDEAGTTTLQVQDHAVDVSTLEPPLDDPNGEPIVSFQTSVATGEEVKITRPMIEELHARRQELQSAGQDARASLKLPELRPHPMDEETRNRPWILQNHELQTTTVFTPEQLQRMQTVLEEQTEAANKALAEPLNKVEQGIERIRTNVRKREGRRGSEEPK